MPDNKVTIDDVADSLIAVGSRLETIWKSHGWSIDANAHTSLNWIAPSVSMNDIKGELEFAADRIRSLNSRTMTKHESTYTYRLKERADQIVVQNLPSDPHAILDNVLEIANSVFRHIPPPAPLPPPPPQVDWEDLKDKKDLLPKDLAKRLRGVEARIKEFEPRAATLREKIEEIEAAHQAANELPADMEELRAKRDEIADLVAQSHDLFDAMEEGERLILEAHSRVENGEEETDQLFSETMEKTEALITRSERALRGATSVGLARAFASRGRTLNLAGLAWTLGLLGALACAVLIGAERVETLRDVLKPGNSASIIWANLLISVLGVGAPVWFAWLSTKQIGASFKLAEDYSFKATISQAYEGYRTEAVDIDPKLKQRLFSTALDRIEEPPIRFLDGETHSGPLSEILSNPAIRKALEGVPGIAGKIIDLIPAKLGGVGNLAPAAAGVATAGATIAEIADEPEEELRESQ